MLIHQGTERDDAADRRLACTLAFVAGALNAAAFYAVGFFSANMTGNVSALSDHVAAGQFLLAGTYLGVVLAFILGAIVCTLLINAGCGKNFRGIYAVAILIEAAGIALLACVDLWWVASWRVHLLVLGLAFLMGLQNAVVTRISDARVRTTHVSGMATDIGIELGLLFDQVHQKNNKNERNHVMRRLRLHVETIGSFLVGGVIGVLIYRHVGGVLFFFASAVLTLIGFHALLHSASRRGDDGPVSNDL